MVIKQVGLMRAISEGKFANITRSIDGGHGLEGVFVKDSDYSNPVMEHLEQDGVIYA